MKFSCLKTHLERAIGCAERFTGKNITLPILGSILLDARDTGLAITATNLEYAVELAVPGQTHLEGKVSVPARIFGAIVQATHEEKITLEAKQGNLIISSDERHGRVNGMNADDFPLVPKIKKTNSFCVDADVLGNALARVLPGVSGSDFKPELGGVFMRVEGVAMTLAATDTFRLAEELITCAQGPASPISCIVPQRTAQELVRILQEYPDQEADIILGENQMMVQVGPVRVTSRLIEGAFPEYRAIVPGAFDTSVFLSKDAFLSAVRSSSIFASKLQDVTLHFSRGCLEVVSSNPELGEYRTKLKVALTGKDTSVSFNYRYLLDGIQSCREPEVFFGCSSSGAPALVRNKSEAGFTYVVMPIRLS